MDVVVVEFLLLAHLVLLAQMVCPVMMVLLDNLAMLAVMDLLLLLNHNAIGVSTALPDLLVVLVMLVVKVLLVTLDNLVVLLMVVLAVLPAQPDLLDPVDNQETQDLLVNPAPLVKFEMSPVQWDLLAQLVPLDNPDNLVLLVNLDMLELLDKLDNLEMLDKLVPPANLVPMEIMAQMENLEPVENVHIVLPHVPHPVIKRFEEVSRLYRFQSWSLISFKTFPLPSFFFFFYSFILSCNNIKNERYK